jgi:hypothetical protein
MTPVEVILRMLVVKRLYDFSYEECERFVCRLHHSEAVLPAVPAARSR